jgi:hypothetical protein
VAIPTDPLFEILETIALRLYEEPLRAFDVHNLAAIPGLDFGPHEEQEALRSCRELLSGRVPARREPRAIITGAILAWKQARSRESEFLNNARAAIVGVTEWAERSQRSQPHAQSTTPLSWQAEARRAFLAHTIFAPPKALQRSRTRHPRRTGTRAVAPRGHHRAGRS